MADDGERHGLLQALPGPPAGRASREWARLLDRGGDLGPGLGQGLLMRRTVAVLAGKATGRLSRLSRRGGGTTFPGDVARAIDPRVLRLLAADLTQGAVLITGTNGKTTTARLVASLLEGQPSRVVANR